MGKQKDKPAAKKMAKAKSSPPKPIAEKLSKSELLAWLAGDSGLTKKEVGCVMASLERLIEASIGPHSVGQFTLPGLMRMSTLQRPAVKARRGINPFTKEEVWFKAKPASTSVRIRPLKKLKRFAN
jgi:nucleoid DNA-binding protein